MAVEAVAFSTAHSTPRPGAATVANVELRIEGKELVILRTIVCGSCKHLRKDTCSVSGMPYRVHTVGFECPKNKQADDNGHLRRFGMRWVGIPAPVRWWKAWRSLSSGEYRHRLDFSSAGFRSPCRPPHLSLGSDSWRRCDRAHLNRTGQSQSAAWQQGGCEASTQGERASLGHRWGGRSLFDVTDCDADDGHGGRTNPL